MLCENCIENVLCKKCYDKQRRLKIKEGNWSFNKALPDRLSDEQIQVLIGGLLGDFYLYRYNRQINAGFEIRRATQDQEYLEEQFNLFKQFCSTGIKDRNRFDKTTNKTYCAKFFRTRAAEVFTPFKDKWYPKGKKIIPKDLILTPLICAIWFCDDGHVKRYGKNKDKLEIRIATNGFKKSEVKFLINLLQKEIDSKFTMYGNPNKGYYIWASHETAIKYINYIKSVFPLSMSRKSNVWKGLV